MKKLPILEHVRAIKSKKELAFIAAAQSIIEKTIRKATDSLKVGITEIEVSKVILGEFIKHKVKSIPFSPIVAFGKGTADVHHEARTTKLKKGDIVMIDLGATVAGYCSDMTRTYFFGIPDSKKKRIYQTVLEAQDKVLKAIEKGERKSKALDKIARSFIEKRFGKKSFPHSLGHGIGTVIHEWPFINDKTSHDLEPGMIITIEPGVYIKGWGGVRLEDMILITPSGYRNLTRTPKEFKDSVIH